MKWWWFSAPALALPLVLTGCGSAQDEVVRESATAFLDAVSAQDWARACDLLAPETRGEVESAAGSPCTSALAEEDFPAPGALERVDVYGTTAEVRYQGETVFLTEFADGWHLLAAGCTAQPPKPYDCAVHGG